MGEVPARSQARPPRHILAAAGNICPRASVCRLGSGHPRQIQTGCGTRQALQLLETQIAEYRREIRRLFVLHPDAKVFGSLPGAGDKIAPRLLAEIGDDRALFPDAQALQCLAGTAPVTYQSGQIHRVYLRRQCNKSLRTAVHLWANLSREFCPWAATYYAALRAKGKSHACALRALGQRWLKIVWRRARSMMLIYTPAIRSSTDRGCYKS